VARPAPPAQASRVLTDPFELEDLEATAWADLYAAAPADSARALGLSCVRLERATVLRAHLPAPLFNRTLGVRALSPALLGATPPGAYLQLAPALLDDAARAALDAAGFAARSRWVKLARPPTPAPEVTSPLTVLAAGAEQGTLFGEALCRAFELPPTLAPWNAALVGRPGWRCYLAFAGAEAVGTAALFRHGDLAWLGAAATVPAHRRRGGQRALIARRIADAIAAGARLLVSETGVPAPGARNPSLDNLQASGFAAAYERANWSRAR
jgi:hypothetical protein